MQRHCLILAAGKGTRMKSELPKVLHSVCGKEMINHVIDTLKESGVNDINAIIGHKAPLVEDATKTKNITYSYQLEQKGTGHAVMCASEFLKEKDGIVAIFSGDAPLITSSTVRRFFDYHCENRNDATILTAKAKNPYGNGRIIRDERCNVLSIVEEKDASPIEKEIKEVNTGTYIFNTRILLEHINRISNNNAQGEYYLTDMIQMLKDSGYKIGAVEAPFEETLGINSPEQLEDAINIYSKRTYDSLLTNIKNNK